VADAPGLRHRLVFDAERGEVRDGDVRYLLIRPDALMGIFRGLPEGPRAEALAAFARSISEHGSRSARKYQAMGADDAAKLLAVIEDTAPHLGWGRWRFVERGPQALRLEVENSPFAAGYGASPVPVCAPVAGMLAAVARLAFGAHWEVAEEHCTSQGRALCRFVAHPAR
jgi:predicted hydrocarbon binding protein